MIKPLICLPIMRKTNKNASGFLSKSEEVKPAKNNNRYLKKSATKRTM